ncbi:MAG: TerC family protein [Ardenticatenia bacterium]|nr:TerC family protein [Ardenticatenia bacterium]
MSDTLWLWIGFNVFVLGMLALDLGVFHRHAHVVKFKEAATWSVVWILLASLFGAGLYWLHPNGPQASLEFFTGYLIEKSLSIDNIFIFVLIFSAFAVPAAYQHRVLFWGILGALVMRGFFIGVGAWMLEQFHWIIYIFGAFLIVTGIKMGLERERVMEIEGNAVVKLTRRIFPVTSEYRKDRFFVREAGKLLATPLFVVLVMVEFTDLIFAVDSIPAIFAVTRDPFLVYSSNVFAIMGLRSLYFLLAGVVDRFHLLKIGLAIVLVFVGIKMLLVETAWKVPTLWSLVVIGGVIGASIALSLIFPKAAKEEMEPEHPVIEG